MCTDTVVRKPAKQVDSSGNDVELDENVKASQYYQCAFSHSISSHGLLKMGFD